MDIRKVSKKDVGKQRDMKIHILNYDDAREFVPQVPTLAIRIFDPGATGNKHPTWGWDNSPDAPFSKELYTDVIESTFSDLYQKYDTDKEWKELEKGIEKDLGGRLFTEEKGKKLLAEFEASYKDAEEIMTHCNAGASRSVAVALALNEIYDLKATWNERVNGFLPGYMKIDLWGNMLVHNTLLKLAGLPTKVGPYKKDRKE